MTIPTDSELAQAYSQGYQDGRRGLLAVLLKLVYENDGKWWTGIIGDSDVTDIVGPALEKAKP